MWRRSWLSREVLLFSAFSGVASLYAGLLWMLGSGDTGLTATLGASDGAVWPGRCDGASGCIYRVAVTPRLEHAAARSCSSRSRPACSVRCSPPPSAPATPAWLALGGADAWLAHAARAAGGALLPPHRRLTALNCVARHGCSRRCCVSRFLTRGLLLAAGGVVLPLLWGGSGWCGGWAGASLSLLLTLGSELLGRYLFFVSVVPKSYGCAVSRAGGRRSMSLKRMLGLDTHPERYAYAVDPVAGYVVRAACG